MLDPGMQIFYLTDRCNNACAFCICKKRLADRIGDSQTLIRQKLDALRQGAIVDVYGGEPTLSPYFLEIVRKARQKHCFINIATNARAFSRKALLEAFLAATMGYQDRIFIRSSLHGHTAALHERHTRRKGSFREALDGIRALKAAGFRVSVNTVITRHNYKHLRDIHRLIERYHVDVFKLSFMRHTVENIGLAVSVKNLKAELPKTLRQAASSGMTIDLDSIPYCVAPAQLALYARDENPFIENDTRVVKPDRCRTCPVMNICPGVDREYFELAGGNELTPIPRRHMETFQAARALRP